jgi:hypothetical protein
MLDLGAQIRSYFDSTSEPVTAEEVLFERLDLNVTTLWRGWRAAAAAAVVVLAFGSAWLLWLRGPDQSVTSVPTTVATTTTVAQEAETPTTTPPTSTTVPASTTTLPPIELGPELPLDPATARLAGHVLEAAQMLGFEVAPEIGWNAGDPVFAWFPPPSGFEEGQGIELQAFPSTADAAAFFESQQTGAFSDNDVERVEGLTVGDESAVWLAPGGRAGPSTTFLVRADDFVLSLRHFDNALGEIDDAARDAYSAHFDTILEALASARASEDSPIISAHLNPGPSLDTYATESQFVVNRTVKDPEEWDFARTYRFETAANGQECSLEPIEFLEFEPQDFVTYTISQDGSVTRTRSFIDERSAETAQIAADDPSFAAALAECTRYPREFDEGGLTVVLDRYEGLPQEPSLVKIGDDRYAFISEGLSYEDLDLAAAVEAGLIGGSISFLTDDLPGGAFEVSVDGSGRVTSLDLRVTGPRSELEEWFSLDLLTVPGEMLELWFDYRYGPIEEG